MTKIARHSIVLIIIMTLMMSGFPHFNSEDANRDERTDLSDTILLIKAFARSANNPETFTETVGKVLSALHVVVGLKTVIKKDSPSGSNLTNLDYPYLISSWIFSTDLIVLKVFIDIIIDYESVAIIPDLPPRISL